MERNRFSDLLNGGSWLITEDTISQLDPEMNPGNSRGIDNKQAQSYATSYTASNNGTYDSNSLGVFDESLDSTHETRFENPQNITYKSAKGEKNSNMNYFKISPIRSGGNLFDTQTISTRDGYTVQMTKVLYTYYIIN